LYGGNAPICLKLTPSKTRSSAQAPPPGAVTISALPLTSPTATRTPFW
jgi:hypothetical protein